MKQKIIDALRERLEPLDYVHALWLEGADANGTADAYSDIDIWTDVADEREADAIAVVEDTLQALGTLDFRHIKPHGHPQIRQRVYHLAGTSEYLVIDFNWQLHSRPREEYCFYTGDPMEQALVLFDKDNIVRYKAFDPAELTGVYAALLADMDYRHTQHARVTKYIHRGQYPEAWAHYQLHVLEPLVYLLRRRYTPAHPDFDYIHISQHIPAADAARLTALMQVGSLAEMPGKIEDARRWYADMRRTLTEEG